MTKKSGEPKHAIPSYVRKGDRLALVAPASPGAARREEGGISLLRAAGLSVGPGPGGPSRPPGLSADDGPRLRDIADAMSDARYAALLAVRGGYGSMRLLRGLRGLWGGFPPSKPLIGFSDISALHLSRLALSGVGGWHAPNLCTLTRLAPGGAAKALGILAGGARAPWPFPKGSVLRKGDASGPLIGGNLTLFSQLYGTPHCPKGSGAILLLEDTAESPYRIDRMLTGLSLRGAFGGCAGVVFGSFLGSGDRGQARGVLRDFAGSLGVPVVMGAPFGHGRANLPWFYGEHAFIEGTADGGARLCFACANRPKGKAARAK